MANTRTVEEETSTKVYVGNLSFQTTEQQLEALFSNQGPIKKVSLSKRRVLKRPQPSESTESVEQDGPKKKEFVFLSKGFGFVEFESEEGAKAAVANLNQTELDGRQIAVELARPLPAAADSVVADAAEGPKTRKKRAPRKKKPVASAQESAAAADSAETRKSPRRRRQDADKPKEQGPPSKTSVFVSNLPFSYSSEQLKEFLQEKGFDVAKAVVVERFNRRDGTKRSKGFGFVEFGSEDEQKRAISELNGSEIEERPVNVRVAYEKPEEVAAAE